MLEKLPLWEAAKREMEVYQFAVEAEIQPKWNVPHKIAINAAIFKSLWRWQAIQANVDRKLRGRSFERD